MNEDKGLSKTSSTEPSNVLISSNEKDYISINLFQLLYKKGWFIIATVALATLMAFGLSSRLTPQFKVTAQLTEPTAQQYKDLFINTASNISQTELFDIFLKKLSNGENFNQFVKQIDPKQTPLKLSKLKSRVSNNTSKGLLRENKHLRFSEITPDGIEAELSIISPNVDSEAFLNKAYIEFTNKQALNLVAQKQKDIVAIKIKKLEQEVNLLTESLISQKTYSINKLKAQINDLKSKPANPANLNEVAKLQEQLNNNVYDLQALTSKNESNDKILLEKKLALEQLKSLSFDTSSINIFKIEGFSTPVAYNPFKKLIIMFGVLAGFILAVSILLLQANIQLRKKLQVSELSHK